MCLPPRRLASFALALLLLPAVPTHAASTTRASLDSQGADPDDECAAPSISSDGRFVAFDSLADDLTPGDTNPFSDVFVRDLNNNTTERVSVSSTGAQGDGDSFAALLSANGRFVAFDSFATNLVKGDTNNLRDVFRHDRKTGKTIRISVSSKGVEGDGSANVTGISKNGRFVAFESSAKNLVKHDENGALDAFLHDCKTGKTTRVSLDANGGEIGGPSGAAVVSKNGRFVAFQSTTSGITPDDTNSVQDVFFHDVKKHKTTLVSVSLTGVSGNALSIDPSISDDGRFVAFASSATDLVPNDGNGSRDAFVRDVKSLATQRVSVDSTNVEANDDSGQPRISATGRFVVFFSFAQNLDGNVGVGGGVCRRDRDAGTTDCVSLPDAGGAADAKCDAPSISSDGRFIAFQSGATNLVANDGNGQLDVFVRDRGE